MVEHKDFTEEIDKQVRALLKSKQGTAPAAPNENAETDNAETNK